MDCLNKGAFNVDNTLPKDGRVKVRRFPIKTTFFMQLVGTYLKK